MPVFHSTPESIKTSPERSCVAKQKGEVSVFLPKGRPSHELV